MAQRVEQALERALRPASGSPRRLDEAMRYCASSSGTGQRPKRFRPLLCLGGCEAVGGRIRAALPAACAVELVHTYSLVHDDLPAMDDADQRRGRASCHRRFGEATAILVGDALLTRAFELLSANGIPRLRLGCRPERSRMDGMPQTLAIIQLLGRAGGTTGLIGGQLLDLQSTVHSPQSTVKRLEEIAKRKTAALITASVVAGGLAGQASSRSLARLRRYGESVGLAFQLMDDLHDGDGVAAVLGSSSVRRKAARLISRARRALEPFGRQGWILHELADWLVKS